MLSARLVRVLAVAPAVLVVTAAQLALPSALFWSERKPVLYVAVALFMVAAMHELFSFVSYFQQLKKIRLYDRDVRAVLSATISQIETATAAQWKMIGASVFCVRGVPLRRQLAQIEDLRLGGGATRVQPRWSPGKGIVGTSFSSEELVCKDWEGFFKEAMSSGRSMWDDRPPVERYGLTWGELVRTESHTWIAAFPIFCPRGKSIGTVVVDAPADLSNPVVARILRDAAATMGDIGKPPNSWWNYVARRND
jgi:hypothetical protein